MIFFLSDFGRADAYVGIVEAVIASIAPSERVVHLAHDVPAQDLRAGSLSLWSAVPFLPDGAIVLAVVDPGVGSARRPIAARGERLVYVGPDNGLFGAAWLRDPLRAVHALESRAHRLASGASTFDGRDVFGPAAAHLAAGVALDALGPALDPTTLAPPPAQPTDAERGEIWSFDRYGNALTTLARSPAAGGVLELPGVRAALGTHFASVARGEPVAYVGSSGLVELAVRDGSAREVLGLRAGDPATLVS